LTAMAANASVPAGPPDSAEIARTAERLAPWVHRTPVLTSRTLDVRCGSKVFFKCENFQRAGAFKFRGALNALLQMNEGERGKGVVTHSSGNHAQALALAGQLLGVPVCVVMPRNAPAVKRAATDGYGARVVLCEPTLAAREGTVAELVARHGYILVHPFDDWRIIAGQATVAWELLDQAESLDVIVCPVGGGGCLSGTALAAHAKSPHTWVIGAEPKMADDACRSLAAGDIIPSDDPKTVADGLRTSLSTRTFTVLREHVKAIVTTTESEILEAMRAVWERLKIIIEPSSAVAVAPVLNRQLPREGARIGVILTGGNVDLHPLFQALAAKSL